MLYDTHCHPYLAEKKSQDGIIKNFLHTWDFLNCIWTNISTSLTSIDIAKNNTSIFATIWIHPCDILRENNWRHTLLDLEKTLQKLEKIYLENKQYIVWIWEIGLDYHWLESMSQNFLKTQIWESAYNKIDKEKCPDIITRISRNIKNYQELFFKAQIKLAQKYNLPIIIHNRNSKDDVFRILEELHFKNFIFHCYSENLEYAERLIEFAPNCKISFSGIVTFKSAKDIQDTAANIPLRNIIIETDSPFLTPTPLRWKEENEPQFVQYVLNKIIELRSENSELIQKTIFQNSVEIFTISSSQTLSKNEILS